MIRPNKEDYKADININWYNKEEYIKDLEKYCDELESSNVEVININAKLVNSLIDYKLNKRKIMKALNKASEKLKDYDSCLLPTLRQTKTKEEWKEWLLEDEM